MSDEINQTPEKPSAEIAEKDREVEIAAATKTGDNTAVILNEKKRLSAPLSDEEAKRQMASRSRRNFLIGGATAVIGFAGWNWMGEETKNALLRRTFEFNEKVSQLFFSPRRLAPEFRPEQISPPRTNGGEGLSEDFNAADWRLRVGGLANRSEDLILTLADIKALPRTEMTTEFKCIEGWSVIASWAGVKFSDFAAKYLPQTRNGSAPDLQNRPGELLRYVSLVTPDEGYYVGWDLPSILHPQTLLAYEMNGAPLTPEHGAPLRLATATKYGIKQIKRIGRIEFTDERPKDFWAERGYDWYAGH